MFYKKKDMNEFLHQYAKIASDALRLTLEEPQFQQVSLSTERIVQIFNGHLNELYQSKLAMRKPERKETPQEFNARMCARQQEEIDQNIEESED